MKKIQGKEKLVMFLSKLSLSNNKYHRLKANTEPKACRNSEKWDKVFLPKYKLLW